MSTTMTSLGPSPLALSIGCVVKITGLQSRDEVNGKLALLTEFVPDAERWITTLIETKEQMRLKPECLVLQLAPGYEVVLQDIQSRYFKELNGRVALAHQFDLDSGRWIVHISQPEPQVLKFRMENLKCPVLEKALEEAERKAAADKVAAEVAAEKKVMEEVERKAAAEMAAIKVQASPQKNTWKVAASPRNVTAEMTTSEEVAAEKNAAEVAARKVEAEAAAKQAAEAKSKAEAEMKAQEAAADVKARQAAEAKANLAAEAKAKQVADAKSKAAAEEKAKQVAEAKSKAAAEAKKKASQEASKTNKRAASASAPKSAAAKAKVEPKKSEAQAKAKGKGGRR